MWRCEKEHMGKHVSLTIICVFNRQLLNYLSLLWCTTGISCDVNLEHLFFDWSSLTTRSQNCEFGCGCGALEVVGCGGGGRWWAKGKRGKKLKLAARASVERISRICLKMAGHACRLMVMEEALARSVAGPLLGVGADFFWGGRVMVKTLVLEPKAPSMDMVSQEGWQEREVVLAAGGQADVVDPC